MYVPFWTFFKSLQFFPCYLSTQPFYPYYYYLTPGNFFTPILTEGFPWSLVPASLQVSRTLLSILANFSSAMVWVASILPVISRSSNLFSRFLGIVPKTPTMIGITITFMFYNFFISMVRSMYLSNFLFSFIFTMRFTGVNCQVFFRSW